MSASQNSPGFQKILEKGWPLFFLLCAIEGTIAFYKLCSIPGDEKNDFLLGLSLSRLLLLGVIAIPVILLAIGSIKSWRDPHWRKKWLEPLKQKKVTLPVLIIAIFSSLSAWLVLLITRYYPEQQLMAFYERLQPPLFWIFLLGIQTVLWLSLVVFGFHPQQAKCSRLFILVSGVSVFAVSLVTIFILNTGIGITPDAVAWGEAGVPLLGWQIWLGVLIGSLGILISLKFPDSFQEKKIGQPWWQKLTNPEILLPFLIWLLAVILWTSLPVPRSYFSLIPRPPNFEVYPYSDAANHDLVAQHILIGDGFENGRVVKRPLLSLFFFVLYLIGGQNYQNVITLQTLVLACFPVFLYLIGKNLHSKPAGLIVGLWSIFREINIISATPYARVSHSKLLLSDLPAALGITVFIYFTIQWFKNPRRNIYPLLCGGSLGLLMLVRTQSIFLLVLILPAALIHFHWKWRNMLRDILILGTGIILCISPWILRNYHFTGHFVFDQTEQTGIIAQRYTDIPGYAMPERLSGETEHEYTQRFLRNTFEFTLENPLAVLNFITAHFINNEISTLLALPTRTEFADLKDMFTITSAFWGHGVLEFTNQQFLIMGLNLLLVCIGIGASYQRWKVIALLPLLMNLAYSLSNAIARNSGGRYILPADWVAYFYFAIGILEVILMILLAFGVTHKTILAITSKEGVVDFNNGDKWNIQIKTLILPGLLFLLAGSTLPLAEIIFPKKYPSQSKQELVEKLFSEEEALENQTDLLTLRDFLDCENVVIMNGRAMYPVYLVTGEGEPGFGWPHLEEHDFSRMSFYLIGPDNSGVIFPSESPLTLPNTSDVLVAGYQKDGYLDAVLLSVNYMETHSIYLRKGQVFNQCP